MASRPYQTGEVYNRGFETVADRAANQVVSSPQQRQRSQSVHRYYSDGSVDRVHIHDNIRSGDQFQHVIGGQNPDGTYWGRTS